jgi:hypothetical protein
MLKNMAITKEQIFEMYIKAAGLVEINSFFRTSKVFRDSNGKKIKEEELRGSSKFAGFLDAVVGNSPKYSPPKGAINPESHAQSELADLVGSLVEVNNEYRNVIGEEGAEMLRINDYLKGYKLGMENKGITQRTQNMPHSGIDMSSEVARDALPKVVSLADYRDTKRR